MEELILKEREVKEQLINIINNSKLPAFVLKSMIEEILTQLIKLEQQQYEQAKKNKENLQKEDEK